MCLFYVCINQMSIFTVGLVAYYSILKPIVQLLLTSESSRFTYIILLFLVTFLGKKAQYIKPVTLKFFFRTFYGSVLTGVMFETSINK